MNEKKKEDLKALTAALIVSDYCRKRGTCDEGCVFATRNGEEMLPCGLREIDVPEHWNGDRFGIGSWLNSLIKEVLQ